MIRFGLVTEAELECVLILARLVLARLMLAFLNVAPCSFWAASRDNGIKDTATKAQISKRKYRIGKLRTIDVLIIAKTQCTVIIKTVSYRSLLMYIVTF